MTFLHQHLPISGRFEPDRLERIDELLFPTAALREALVNALCHRDYSRAESATQSNDPVVRLLNALQGGNKSSGEIRKALGSKHRPTFRKNYLHPAQQLGFIEFTIPGKPQSRLQKYRLTEKGKAVVSNLVTDQAAPPQNQLDPSPREQAPPPNAEHSDTPTDQAPSAETGQKS